MKKSILLTILVSSFYLIGKAQDAETRIKDKGIVLATPSKPMANYVNAVRHGNLLFRAGKGPAKPDGTNVTGKVGKDLTIEQGYEAARLTAINHLSVLKAELGDLEKVKRVMKVLGMVNSTPEYEKHPIVINGCSELFVELWGEDNGKGVRSAVGMGSLPGNVAVEIEAMFEIC